MRQLPDVLRNISIPMRWWWSPVLGQCRVSFILLHGEVTLFGAAEFCCDMGITHKVHL